MELYAFVDSKTVFGIIAKDGQTRDRRCQIDINALRESYDNRELTKLGWIPGVMNLADALTKQHTGTYTPLWNLMTTNTLILKAQDWASVVNKGNVAGVSDQQQSSFAKSHPPDRIDAHEEII